MRRDERLEMPAGDRSVRHAMALALAGLLLAGCGDDESGGGPGGTGTGECTDASCSPVPEVTCAEGFEALPETVGCGPTLPFDACPPGSMPLIGAEECQSVGIVTCPTGFELASSGWGCEPTLPSSKCTGATMERIGESSCQPIGDCDAPFPPAEAGYFVDDDFSDAELDGTHFRTIFDALSAAPADQVVAVYPGTYAESLGFAESATVVGKCAEETILEAPAPGALGLFFDGAGEVEIRGVTLRGYAGAVGVYGTTVTVRDVLIEDNTKVGVAALDGDAAAIVIDSVVRGTLNEGGTQAHGLFAQGGGTVELIGTVVDANEFTNLASVGSTLRLDRSIVRDGFPQTAGNAAGLLGVGIYAVDGSTLEVTDSYFSANFGDGILVGAVGNGAPSVGTVRGTTVVGTQLSSSGYGRGVEVNNGSSLQVEGCTLRENTEANLLVTEASTAVVADTAAVGPDADDGSPSGVGVLVSDGAEVTLTGVAMVHNRIVGLQAQATGSAILDRSFIFASLPALTPPPGTSQLYGMGINVRTAGQLRITDSSVVSTRGTSVLLDGQGTNAWLAGLLVDATLPDENGNFGRGLSVQEGAHIELSGSAVRDSRELGLMIIDPGSLATIADTSILGTRFDESGGYGHGVVILDGADTTLSHTSITNNAGIGIAVAAAHGFLTAGYVSSNSVGAHALGGSSFVESDAPVSDPLGIAVSSDTSFNDNGVLYGSGEIPIPTPIDFSAE